MLQYVGPPASLPQATQAIVRLPLEVIGLDGQISAKDQDQQQPRHSACIPRWVRTPLAS